MPVAEQEMLAELEQIAAKIIDWLRGKDRGWIKSDCRNGQGSK